MGGERDNGESRRRQTTKSQLPRQHRGPTKRRVQAVLGERAIRKRTSRSSYVGRTSYL